MQTKWQFATPGLIAGAVLILAAGTGSAQENPYAAIAVQNPFHLRQVRASTVEPVHPTPPPPSTVDVRVTGVTDVCGRPQVLLEITAADKQTTWPVLREGDGLGGIEILRIDVIESRVVTRIDEKDTVLTFHPNKTPPVAPRLTIPAGGREPPANRP